MVKLKYFPTILKILKEINEEKYFIAFLHLTSIIFSYFILFSIL